MKSISSGETYLSFWQRKLVHNWISPVYVVISLQNTERKICFRGSCWVQDLDWGQGSQPPPTAYLHTSAPRAFGIQGLGLRVWGLGCGMKDLGFGVWGMGF